jgi:hypothetical protein
MVYRKKVLISPSDSKTGLRSKTLSVNLTQEKIKKQSDIETDKPVSRTGRVDSWILLLARWKRNVWTHGLRRLGISIS